MVLIAISNVDIKQNTFTFNGWNRFYWNDNRLRWNPVKHNNIYNMTIDSENIWKPDIIPLLFSGIPDNDNTVMKSAKMVVQHTGDIFWAVPFI